MSDAPIIVPPPPVHVPGGQSGGDTGGHPLPWTVTQWAWIGGLTLLLVACLVVIVVLEVRWRRARKGGRPVNKALGRSRDLTPDWCDPVAVLRVLNGRPVGRPLHHAEKVAIARLVLDQEDGTSQVSKLLGCNGVIANELLEEARCSA